MEAVRWKIGDGKSTLFWLDTWSGVLPLRDQFPRIFELIINKAGTVDQFYRREPQPGGWHFEMSEPLLHEEDASLSDLVYGLQGVLPLNSMADAAIWSPNPRDGFSVRGCYTWWRRNIPIMVEIAQKFKEIWKTKSPLKVRFFLWLVYQDKLLTKSYRAKWAPREDKTCLTCGGGEETTTHIMIDCPMAKLIWKRVSEATELKDGCDSLETLWRVGKQIHTRGDKSAKNKVSQIIIPAVLWALWISRNHFLFRGTKVYEENVWEMAKHHIKDWGTVCAGASSISFPMGFLHVEE
ncbi:hypothetical protein QJS10_CPB17g01023 [Acorus calamus]|uniref:Reverse transcriptase zinc-binding domain-containing protein n=1 Tax=Acorus calamus TaxID=4465 RepID=A0AAV9CU56_ACOCL|nr:hypothetical protein QJS10_CPB17g01023 [Acorus calamus]